MTRQNWLCGTAALALLTCAGIVPAQERRLSLDLAERQRWDAIREGKKLVQDPNAQEAQKNVEAIRKMAHVRINLMLKAAETAGGAGDNPISDAVRGLNEIIIDPQNPVRKLTEGQKDLIHYFGKEMTDELKKIIGTKDQPSGTDILVKINSARMLSILAKSGYEGLADVAVEVLTNPQQHDAVKYYILESLRNLFAVPHHEQPEQSVLFKNMAQETKAIVALCEFVARKQQFAPNTPKEEVDAYRYVRRQAVRALGQVRKQVVRNPNTGQIEAMPAIWLLRVANMDQSLAPSPSLSERVEGLVGYLQLYPDKDVNMDFAIGFSARAIDDLARECQQRKIPDKPKADDKKPPEVSPVERDSHAWRLTAMRISVGLKVWKDRWEDPVLGARPAEIRKLLNGLVSAAEKDVLNLIVEGKSDQIQSLDNNFLKNNEFPNAILYNDDKNSFIARPGTAGGQ